MIELADLAAAFRERYGESPTHVVRAPGRVNLIGEHIDYNGLSVLPMAIQRWVTLLFRPRDGAIVRVANTDKEYPTRAFALSEAIEPYPEGDWGNYLKAAGQGLVQRFGNLSGYDAVMTSSIPAAAGLSSSSALTVASALPLAQVNQLQVDRVELAELLAHAERYVGIQSGGMDQAVCLGGTRGAALRVDFAPLQLTTIPVPDSITFVVASSMLPAEKSGAAGEIYNRRTRECREALQAVLRHLGAARRVDSYRGLLDRVDTAELLDAGEAALEGDLRRRFRHVVSEARRVHLAEAALAAGELAELGWLLNESHASLRDDYQVSCAELDELTELAGAGGAAGARLTGAGLGGCIVAVCAADRASQVVERLSEDFYRSRNSGSDLNEHLFIAEASGGASVEPL